ncbi:hypothetical protein ACFFJX_01235 [Pseudarcicella hirudinis]
MKSNILNKVPVSLNYRDIRQSTHYKIMTLPKPLLIFLSIFFPILLILTLYHRAEDFDDAWFAEQSYWLLKDGKVRSEFFSGLLGWENQIYVFHKLFVYTGAFLMTLFGESLYTSKSISLIFLGLLLLAFFLYFQSQPRWKFRFILALILLLSNVVIVEYSFINRPEMMLVTLGFLSYYFLEKRLFLASGILAGLAVLTHLNGLIYLGAGFCLLLFQKEKKGLLLFAISGAIVSGFYFLDAFLNQDIPTLITQFRNDPATADAFSWRNKLKIMADYHQLFFFSEDEIILTATTILLVWRSWKQAFFSKYSSLFLYTACLIIIFWIILKSNFAYYYLLFTPFFILIIVQILADISDRTSIIISRVCLIVYFLIGIRGIFLIIQDDFSNPTLAEKNANLAKWMPRKNVRIIAPLDFFYEQIHHFRIHGTHYFKLLNQKNYQDKRSPEDFFAKAKADHVEYVIFEKKMVGDRSLLQSTCLMPPIAPHRIASYIKVYEDKMNCLYALEQTPFYAENTNSYK